MFKLALMPCFCKTDVVGSAFLVSWLGRPNKNQKKVK